MFHGDHWMWGMHGGWWILIFLVLIVLFWAISRNVRGPENRASDSPSTTPLEELKRRYAAGEISTEEFEERKRTLESA